MISTRRVRFKCRPPWTKKIARAIGSENCARNKAELALGPYLLLHSRHKNWDLISPDTETSCFGIGQTTRSIIPAELTGTLIGLLVLSAGKLTRQSRGSKESLGKN